MANIAPTAPAPAPAPQQSKQDCLQTALLYLARAAAQLPKATAESLFVFAKPNRTPEKWMAEVERERASAAARGSQAGVEGETGRVMNGRIGAGVWVELAIEVLKREGEKGEYWRDGRELSAWWELVGGDDV